MSISAPTLLKQKSIPNTISAQDFSKSQQAVIAKIQAAKSVDEIMAEMSKDIRALFGADRLTIYLLSDDKYFYHPC